ncbi:hypothetical protein HWV62_13932 [Athelia sp. TMB]|nr:hypothetical protein HWV62_13932 [Athelia sp. TMB]
MAYLPLTQLARIVDTLRLRIQTHPGATLPTLAELIPKPAVRGLYAGLPVAVVVGIPALSIYLSAYEGAKALLSAHFPAADGSQGLARQLPIFLAAGMTAEVASATIWTPMEVVKSRLQRGGEGNSATMLLKRIWREEGHRGVFRGFWMGIAVWGPQVSLYWMFYETLKSRFLPGYPISPSSGLSEREHALRCIAASSMACGAAVTITNPIDAIQARWQVSGGRAGSLRDLVAAMWKVGGSGAFVRGVGARLAYTVPANAISMGSYEFLKRRVRERGWGWGS